MFEIRVAKLNTKIFVCLPVFVVRARVCEVF